MRSTQKYIYSNPSSSSFSSLSPFNLLRLLLQVRCPLPLHLLLLQQLLLLLQQSCSPPLHPPAPGNNLTMYTGSSSAMSSPADAH